MVVVCDVHKERTRKKRVLAVVVNPASKWTTGKKTKTKKHRQAKKNSYESVVDVSALLVASSWIKA